MWQLEVSEWVSGMQKHSTPITKRLERINWKKVYVDRYEFRKPVCFVTGKSSCCIVAIANMPQAYRYAPPVRCIGRSEEFITTGPLLER